MTSSTLITTIFEKTLATELSIRDFNIRKVIALVDKEIKNEQKESLENLKKTFNNIIEFKIEKVGLYEILDTAKEVVEIIRSIPKDETIFVDISQSVKSQAIGVLFACYRESERINKIVYWTKDKKMVLLPKLSLQVDNDKIKILKKIQPSANLTELADDLKMSRTTLYRHLENLESLGMIIKNENGYAVTEAGNIALL